MQSAVNKLESDGNDILKKLGAEMKQVRAYKI